MRKHREIFLHSIRMSVQCIRTSVQCIQAKPRDYPPCFGNTSFQKMITHETLLLKSDTFSISTYSKTCLKRPLKKSTKTGFQYWLSLNVGQKYCRILQGEHSVILSTLIKLPFSIDIFVLSIFEWPLTTCFTVHWTRW